MAWWCEYFGHPNSVSGEAGEELIGWRMPKEGLVVAATLEAAEVGVVFGVEVVEEVE